MTRCPPPQPAGCPSNGNPPRGTCLGDTMAPPQGTPPPTSATPDQDRETMPPPHPQRRSTAPFDDAR